MDPCIPTFAEGTNSLLSSPQMSSQYHPIFTFRTRPTLNDFVVTVSCHWLYGPTPAFAAVNIATSSVGEGAGGTVGRGLVGVGGKSDPDVGPELVTTLDHLICSKGVDTREIDPVFYAYVLSLFWI